MNLANNGMILCRKKYCILEYDGQPKYLVQHWIGFLKPCLFRRWYLKTIKFFKKYNVGTIICNTKDLLVISDKEVNWAALYVAPNIGSTWFKTNVICYTREPFYKAACWGFCKKKSKNVFEMHYFSSLERAVLWIKKEVISTILSNSNYTLCYQEAIWNN